MIFVQDLSVRLLFGGRVVYPLHFNPPNSFVANWLRRLRQLEQLMAKAMLIAIVDLARLLVKTEAQVKQIFIFTYRTNNKAKTSHP